MGSEPLAWYLENKGSLRLNIYVVPSSSRSEVVGPYNDCLKIKLKAPPVDNEANKELVRFLAKTLKVPKSNIEIVSGHRQKRKVVCIIGVRAILALTPGFNL